MTDPWETDESKIYESIFGPNGRWQHDGPSIATGWYGCATAYKTSADLLVDGLSACPVNKPDLARPIMFLYRHYLELVLKGVLGTLRACQFYLAEPTGKPRVNPKPRHRLMEIWEQIQAAISELESGIPDYLTEQVQIITDRIGELEEVDAPSTRFSQVPGRHSGESYLEEATEQVRIAPGERRHSRDVQAHGGNRLRSRGKISGTLANVRIRTVVGPFWQRRWNAVDISNFREHFI